MIRNLKNILTGLKNLWKWRKVIYKDRNWDHWYILEILKTKLTFQAQHLQEHGITESSTEHAMQMFKCAELIHIIQNEVYIEDALEGVENRQWTDEMFNEAVKKQEQAKEELFNILKNNIECWWD